MLKHQRVVRESSQLFDQAVERTIGAYRQGRVQQEPAFTDRMLASIERELDGTAIRGLKWQAMTLTDRAPGAQEKKYGADFLGVLSIDVPGFSIQKGFRAQAKIAEPGKPFRRSDFERMQEQAADMLTISAESFIFFYSKQDVRIVPASAVVASVARSPRSLYHRTPTGFFTSHMQCFVGDTRLAVPHVKTLDKIRLEGLCAENNVRSAISLTLTKPPA